MNPLQELIHEMYVEFVPESVKKNDWEYLFNQNQYTHLTLTNTLWV
jgi:hypothetical protein